LKIAYLAHDTSAENPGGAPVLLQQRILDFDLWEAEAAVRSPSHSEGPSSQNSIFDQKMVDAEGIEPSTCRLREQQQTQYQRLTRNGWHPKEA